MTHLGFFVEPRCISGINNISAMLFRRVLGVQTDIFPMPKAAKLAMVPVKRAALLFAEINPNRHTI
jgi:hypothetical protein